MNQNGWDDYVYGGEEEPISKWAMLGCILYLVCSLAMLSLAIYGLWVLAT